MIVNEQYIPAMERATNYIDCLLNAKTDVESIIVLVVTAWESIRDYSRSVFKEAHKEYSRLENKYWAEFIETTTMSDKDKRRRKRKQYEDWDPSQQQELKEKLFVATRFKIDCERSLIQSTEWSRYVRGQQRLLQKQ